MRSTGVFFIVSSFRTGTVTAPSKGVSVYSDNLWTLPLLLFECPMFHSPRSNAGDVVDWRKDRSARIIRTPAELAPTKAAVASGRARVYSSIEHVCCSSLLEDSEDVYKIV